MLEAAAQGFLNLLQPDIFATIIIGILIGLILGILPGVGGLTALALLISFIWGMKPLLALVLLLSINSASSQGGSLTAILLNVPGDSTNAATLLDGYPMAKQGKAGRAIGAVLTASALGGLLGGLIIIVLLPVARPLVLSFGSPETFFLVLLGLSFVATLTGGSVVKGLAAGGFGVLLALIGYQDVTAIPRFTFGILYLEDGIKLVPIVMGLFAVPEAIEMATQKGTIANTSVEAVKVGSDLYQGVLDVFRNFWVFLRCSIMGTFMGFVPGIGAMIATFVAYGHAKQTSRHPERFGQGEVAGVIAPEAAQNAKEGGSLLITLAFGLPSGAAMALILGAFMVLGITPGPKFLEENLILGLSLAWTVILSNVLASAISFFSARQLVKITTINMSILVPLILLLVAIGAYSADQNPVDILAAFAFGFIGYAAKVFGFNRPAILLGCILGGLAETYFLISLKSYGFSFIWRPICIILLVITILGLAYPSFMRKRHKELMAE